ncbi:hypothetical protein TVD_12120 [Thioalkalivibrio versutus]|uniref:Uncharacterized protein n=1 Tax=Thioalkalivibrio versutus TaxID=106634 RepID=A0A0G3G480_9GAMM|nr:MULTISPECIES: hypothetical protein [Thioalkalivibrio]AKJ96053.1 hypothetical protein TVD_12120 [Thioalkalivibrio versutus]
MKRLAILAPAALLAFALSAPTHAAHPVAAAGASTFDAGALQHVRHGHSSGHKDYRGHPGARGHKQAKRAKSRGRGHQKHSRGHEHHHYHYYDHRSSHYRHRSSPAGSVNLHLRLPF